MSDTKVVLVSGATGKQGGAVVDQLVNDPEFTILALTRNASSNSARKLSQKGNNIKLVQGDQNDVPALFRAAQEVAGSPIWGVFSIQTMQGDTSKNGETIAVEVKQGCDMVDESVKAGVKHFVYTSVERGGDERSWENPTNVPHFRTKHSIELHLRHNAGSMRWTVLRPVAFMDNLSPGFPARVFMAALRDTLGRKKMQFVAIKDIGAFARLAFREPSDFNHKAIGLAGSEMTTAEYCDTVERKSTVSIQPTFWIFGTLLKYMVREVGLMVDWFGAEGYNVDIAALKKMHPALLDFESWLEKESSFPMRS